MSAIVGLLRIDGAALSPDLLDEMTASLAEYGPDGRGVWLGMGVGLGHALLRTSQAPAPEIQPLSLDRKVWIVADARLDARGELVQTLRDTTPDLSVDATDVELILRAHSRWGEACVDHLLGDFAFAIWDARARRLFCACDHMGIKSMFYAERAPWLLFSTSLTTLRRHPVVSDRLNEQAIADFLLFEGNLDPHTTSFSDIRNLPPAHVLTWSPVAGVQTRRYWTMPMDEPVYYRHDREYVDRFKELLRQAVADRTGSEPVTVFMSGGLDSPALAVAAIDVLGDPRAVQAVTWGYERLFEDRERPYAEMAARHLGIPLRFFARDAEQDLRWRSRGEFMTPEPVRDLLPVASFTEGYRAARAHGRVVLYGEGPDNALMYEWSPYLRRLREQGRWGRVVRDVAAHAMHHRRVPLLPSIPKIVRERLAARRTDAAESKLPEWFNASFLERFDLQRRWTEDAQGQSAPAVHPLRPMAYESLHLTNWQRLFRGVTVPDGVNTVEVRHPYLDTRLLRFMLQVPAMPWCRTKHLFRQALKGALPQALLTRPKTLLPAWPDYVLAERRGVPPVIPSPRLEQFGNPSQMPAVVPPRLADFHLVSRFVALSHWLFGLDSRSMQPVVFKEGDDRYELAIS